MIEKYDILGKKIALFLILGLTLFAILTEVTTTFYLIYLFWWDEIFRSLTDLFTYIFRKDVFTQSETFLFRFKGRIFFLAIYFVFIIVLFGFVINANQYNLIALNFEVFFFQNIWFNFSLFSMLLREIIVFYQQPLHSREGYGIVSNGIITLHISIILGILLWFIFSYKFEIKDASGNFYSVWAVIPFLVIKIIFEYFEIRHEEKATLN
jgi:hypothetical protein